ncbi:MAG: hypothetical protein HYY96_01590 [Candidatus Tectomicrobia bacterium]|nr:hypothetical protein [Candidatus Tectomicrobia bacterium]
MKHRVARGLLIVFVLLASSAVATAQGAAPGAQRLSARGMITAVAEKGVTVKTPDGELTTVPLAKLGVRRYAPISFNDLKPNDYIGITGKRMGGGMMSASMVHVFPEDMRGRAEGQFPFYGGNMMTNAAVASIMKKGMGHDIVVKYKDKSETVEIPEKAVITRLTSAKKEDLKVGQEVVVIGMKPANGPAEYAVVGILP